MATAYGNLDVKEGRGAGQNDDIDNRRELDVLQEKLYSSIDSACQRQNIEDVIWYQSPTDKEKIIILGVTAEDDLLAFNEIQTEFSMFNLVLRGSTNLLTTPYRTSPLSIEYEQSNTTHKSTCGLILKDDSSSMEEDSTPSNGSRKLYAVTCAHLFLSDLQCEELLRKENPTTIATMRENIKSSKFTFSFQVQDGSVSKRSLDSPSFCYRHYFYPNVLTQDGKHYCSIGTCKLSSEKSQCHHHYMNDIAVFRLPNETAQELYEKITGDHSRFFDCCFEGIKSIEVGPLWGESISERIYLGPWSYKRWNGIHTPTISGRKYAHNLMFRPDDGTENKGKELQPGDSGSIVYVVKEDGKRYAIGIFIGAFDTSAKIYQAILLKPALCDIKMDYDDINELEYFNPTECLSSNRNNFSRSSSTVRPPV